MIRRTPHRVPGRIGGRGLLTPPAGECGVVFAAGSNDPALPCARGAIEFALRRFAGLH